MTDMKDRRFTEITELVEAGKKTYTGLSDAVWDFAEPRFQERRSSALQADYLASRGFRVRRGLAGEETAFVAEAGDSGPVIAFLGEFDALSQLQQEAGATERRPLPDKTCGHGCGHHLLGTASLAAADALKQYLERRGLAGRVRYYGCPAEENAGGKAFLVRDGYFDDCDAVFTWHPHTTNKAMGRDRFLANFRAFFTFHGISSHAAAAPHLGRSALDAVEIMDVGVNYMREHMIESARIHGAITDAGGTAPNVIPSRAQVLYALRAPKIAQVRALFDRMCKIAQGAALITETTVEVRQVAAYANVLGNPTLERLMDEILRRRVPLDYTEEEKACAARFKAVTTEQDRENLSDLLRSLAESPREYEALSEMPLLNFVLDRRLTHGGGGSTDAGNVSFVAPFAQVNVCCFAAGTALHSWQAAAQGKSAPAHRGMLTAAKVMAEAGATLLEDPRLLAQAKADFKEAIAREPMPEMLPPDASPEIW